MRFNAWSYAQTCDAICTFGARTDLACLRGVGHDGDHIPVARDAAQADGVCFYCRCPEGQAHHPQCNGGFTEPCRFDQSVGGCASGLRCGKPTVAVCTTRDDPGVQTRVCEAHLRCYAGNYITWWERDTCRVIEDHDLGDV